MPEADLDLLRDAGDAAAKIALRYFKSHVEVWDKGNDQGPVSQADLEIDQMLKTELRAARPTYGWLSEETEDDPARLEHDTIFIVDPIDGTRSFINGHDDFAISLGIATKGVVTHGVVKMPVKSITYAAMQDQGATKNGEPLQITNRQDIHGARVLAAGAQLESPHWKDGAPPIERHFRSSLAYRLSLVAQGTFDGMLTLRPTWEWDVAAGDIICREAGADTVDRFGKRPIYNNPEAQHAGFFAGHEKLVAQARTYLRDD